MNKRLERMAISGPENRDLLLDDLNDNLQSSPMDEADARDLVADLSKMVAQDGRAAVQESFFNVMATLYLRGIAQQSIERIALDRVATLPVGAVCHVLEIVGASKLPSKRDLLSKFAEQDNPHLSALARALLRAG